MIHRTINPSKLVKLRWIYSINSFDLICNLGFSVVVVLQQQLHVPKA